MIKKYFLFVALFLFVLVFTSGAYAQNRPQIVIEHITESAQLFGSETPDGSDTKIINTQRNPTINDIKDAMKKKKKVTIGIVLRNATDKWAHAARVVSFNTTAYNGTNTDNETILFYDAEVYDPTTNATYNLTFSYIFNDPSRGYLGWGGQWVPVRDVITMYKTDTPKNPGLIRIKPDHFWFVPLIKLEGQVLPKLHFH